jgi:hypothetical protein
MTHTEPALHRPPAIVRDEVGGAATLVAQGVVAQGEQPPGQRHPGDLDAPVLGDLAAKRFSSGSRTAVVVASTSIQRSHREPCLAMWPRWVWASLCAPQQWAGPRSTVAPGWKSG